MDKWSLKIPKFDTHTILNVPYNFHILAISQFIRLDPQKNQSISPDQSTRDSPLFQIH